jgi:type VI secretion system protein ImpL
MIRTFLAGFWSWRALFTLIGLTSLSLVVWFIGPLVTLGLFGSPDVAPLSSPGSRILTIVGLFGVALAIAILRFWLARRANQKMIASLLATEQMAAISDRRDSEEVEIIRERFQMALKVLKDEVFQGRRGTGYLFDLPWYMIIGPPGAGKTTILRHSGLNFPLAERMGGEVVSGIGGTRHCDWWFTDDAVLIDTAGRYTTQDVNSDLDRAAWLGFLDLLRTHRRRRPINGVLLALSLSDVLTWSEAERKRHADALRKRIQELLRAFGMQIPIYFMLTKCDLLAGFTEYFDDVEDAERAQVWGMTFPADGAATRITELFDEGFKELGRRIERGLPAKMHGERSLRRRAAMFMFPKEFASARAAIGSLVHEVFRPTRFDATPMLRGVYFTSGTQEGTPIDRLVGALGRSFGLAGGARSPFRGQGKAFFIRRLLTDVVFEEQGLVGTDRRLERRLAIVNAAAYAACIGAVGIAGALWWGAYARSEARIVSTDLAAQTLQARIGEAQGPLNFSTVLPVLDAGRRVREATGDDSLVAWLDGIGLSATPRLGPRANEVYDRVIIDRLMPAFERRIAERLNAALNTADAQTVRELLRVYLMLGDPQRYARGPVGDAARAELPLAFPIDRQQRGAMALHIDRMLELMPRALEINQALVAAARSRLTREPRTAQIYARLLREGAQSQRLLTLDFAAIVGNTSLQINATRGGNVLRLGIPGIFTRQGFNEFVMPRLPDLVREEQGTDWVIAAGSADDAMFQRVTREVLDRYVQDYIRQWNEAISAVAAIPFNDLPRGMVVLQALAGPQSPLEAVIEAVRDNTNLPPPTADAQQQAPGTLRQIVSSVPGGAQLAGAVARNLGGAPAVAAALGDAPWPGQRIADAFRPLIALTTAGQQGQQPPIARVRELLSNLYGTMGGVANAPDPKQAAYQLLQRRIRDPSQDVFATLRSDSALRPEPVRSILREITSASWSSLLGLAYDYMNDAWRRQVLPVCEGSIAQRYPVFANASEDMAVRDFSDFFRSGGVLDEFFKNFLEPVVVDQRNGYGAARIDGVALPLRPETLAQFNRARNIRRAFFPTPGQPPSVRFSLRPAFLHPQVLRATLTLDGRDIVYRHEQPRAYDIEWPARAETSTVSVVLTLTNGQEQRVERSGPWALFRLADASGLATRGTTDRFQFTVGEANGPRIVYDLRASSVTNPFSLDSLRSFRCPDSL